jgi:hypothetical protein
MGRAPVKAGIALQQIGGPNSLSLDQIVVPKIPEVVCQPFRRSILPPSIDSHQRRIGMIPVPDPLGQGRSALLNRLGNHQQSINQSLGYHTCCGPWTNSDGVWEPPSKGGTIGANISLLACLMEEKLYWQWAIGVGVVRRSKASLMGISRLRWFPLNPFRSPNHVTTRLILLTQPLLIRPTSLHINSGDTRHLCHVF